MANVLDQSQTFENDYVVFGRNIARRLAQSFTVSTENYAKISQFKVRLAKEGAPTDSLMLSIYDGGVNDPGTLVVTADSTVPASSINSGFANVGDVTFTFTNAPYLRLNHTYWAVLERTGSLDETNHYNIATSNETENPYTRGVMYFTDNTGWRRANFSASFYHFTFYQYYDSTTLRISLIDNASRQSSSISNVSRTTSDIVDEDRATSSEQWSTILSTWADEERTWQLAGSKISNDSRI